MDSFWLEKFRSIPDMSAAIHANKSTFLLKKWVSCVFISLGRFFAIIVTARLLVQSGLCPTLILIEVSPESFFRVVLGLPDGLWPLYQRGALTPFCFRYIPSEYSDFAAVGDEIHGEFGYGNDGSDFVQGGSSDYCIVHRVGSLVAIGLSHLLYPGGFLCGWFMLLVVCLTSFEEKVMARGGLLARVLGITSTAKHECQLLFFAFLEGEFPSSGIPPEIIAIS
ncbi:hypothetical protein PIB30_090435 [Stylosanthes scabra]|uniref:Uncharacterized protein n=1 Tax=Stylosanthes scabra TaxID=79078 RepID=A0ABU6XU38_9FABA|nr:hypothetical protein [Stylosanthes scabra]